ncbi:myocilin opposite strand protein [Equus caballus]|uniref:myocilin opposite strand protein n=1 Tax=Equus caballus TaxID=9796 RepID=UPI0038B309F2
MAQQSPTGKGIDLPIRDLALEVTRRRFTLTTREEMFTKKGDEAQEMLSDSDLEQVGPPGTEGPAVPPPPPPSPAEDSEVS